MIEGARRGSKKYGFTFFDVGDPRQGIAHVIAPELAVALPGLTLVCGDSHTCTIGGVGALAWGIGSTEGEHVLATQTLAQVKPKTMRVTFDGKLPAGVFPKDMVLHLIGRIGANGGIGYAVEFSGAAVKALPVEGRLTLCNMAIEFGGSAIRSLTVEGRMTVCNMAIEAGARAGMVAVDDKTIEYLKGRPLAPTGVEWDQACLLYTSDAADEL